MSEQAPFLLRRWVVDGSRVEITLTTAPGEAGMGRLSEAILAFGRSLSGQPPSPTTTPGSLGDVMGGEG